MFDVWSGSYSKYINTEQWQTDKYMVLDLQVKTFGKAATVKHRYQISWLYLPQLQKIKFG